MRVGVASESEQSIAEATTYAISSGTYILSSFQQKHLATLNIGCYGTILNYQQLKAPATFTESPYLSTRNQKTHYIHAIRGKVKWRRPNRFF